MPSTRAEQRLHEALVVELFLAMAELETDEARERNSPRKPGGSERSRVTGTSFAPDMAGESPHQGNNHVAFNS